MQQNDTADDDSRDAELMQQIRNHRSEAALRELMQRHGNAVFAMGYRMLNNSADAEDITQRTFIRVWNAADGYRPDAKFTTWLFTIVKHLVFNESRRRQRKPVLSLTDADTDEEHDHPAPAAEAPDAALEHRELEQAVNRALNALPPKMRMAIQLRRYQELSYEEIAFILDLTESAAKSLLFRARRQLREALKAFL